MTYGEAEARNAHAIPGNCEYYPKISDAQFGALMRAVFAYRFGGGTYSGMTQPLTWHSKPWQGR